MIAGGRYLSGDDAMRVFVAGVARELDIEVVWRGGRRSVVRGARANHVYEIAEEGAVPAERVVTHPLAPLFEDVSARLNHTHVDAVYDDFARQPLLPRKLSTLGPGIAWADVDGDGNEDLIIGGGREGRAAVFRHRARGGFEEWTETALPGENIRDQTGLLGWRGTDGVMRLVIGESNWEDADRNAPAFRVFAMGAGPNSGDAAMDADDAPPLAARDVFTGPLAMGDVDGLAFRPAWAMTENVGDEAAIILNRNDVWAWESPLLTFRFEEKQGPAVIELALFAYFATKVLRPAGLSSLRYIA
jgi:hypothetical protein